MKKIAMTLLSALLLSFPAFAADMVTNPESDLPASAKNTVKKTTKTTAPKPKRSFEEEVKDYNFEEVSNNISNAELEEASKPEPVEEKQSFWTTVVNSSHFSSETATKTYIPVNKDMAENRVEDKK